MFSSQTYDVAIVGGGIVGLATAIGLAQADVKVVVIDAGQAEEVTGQPRLRVSAINKASERLLTRLGAWADIDASRATPYQNMVVWDKDSSGRIDFDAGSIGAISLGNIIENDAVHYALAKRASECDLLTHIENQSLVSMALGEREAWLTLADGDHLSAALVIAADGANSWVRTQCNIPLTFWDYGHHAIVATIRTEAKHLATARQFFLPDGPLAFLPLYDDNLCSIVWSVPPERASALLNMDQVQFERSLTAAFDARLGICQLESERQAFPLRMRFARHFARQRLILAGDAAHTIHPLAGQGVNLGLLDAASIIEVVSQLHQAGQDIGDYTKLRALERWRKADAMEMVAAMEGFKRLFSGRQPLKVALRDLGLNFVNNATGLKSVFMRHAMGNKANLPKLCR